jgi:hypothetical protein
MPSPDHLLVPEAAPGDARRRLQRQQDSWEGSSAGSEGGGGWYLCDQLVETGCRVEDVTWIFIQSSSRNIF